MPPSSWFSPSSSSSIWSLEYCYPALKVSAIVGGFPLYIWEYSYFMRCLKSWNLYRLASFFICERGLAY